MSAFDDVRGATARLVRGSREDRVRFVNRPITLEQLLDAMQREFGGPGWLGGPELPKP